MPFLAAVLLSVFCDAPLLISAIILSFPFSPQRCITSQSSSVMISPPSVCHSGYHWLPVPILSAPLSSIASRCAVWEARRGQQAALSLCWLKTLHGLKAADCQGVSAGFYPQARPELRQSQADASCLDVLEASACSGGETKLGPVPSILNTLPGCCRSGVHLDILRKS